jgi:hypothetical protein
MADGQNGNRSLVSGLDASPPTGTTQHASCFADIVAYFQQEHPGRFLLDEAKHTIRWVVTGDHGTITVVVGWEGEAQRVFIRVPNITTVPKEKHVPAAVLSTMINWKLAIGDFELDFTDGEVAFRNNLTVGDGQLGQKQLETVCMGSAVAVDHFLPAFQRLLWSDASPEEALASVTE